MKRINNLSEVNSLIKKHFVKNVYTNNFISDETYEKEIRRGSLWYKENDSGLFLFRNRDGFFVMNFHVHGEFNPEISDEKIVCEIPFRGDIKYKDSFTENGFAVALNRIRMTAVSPEKENVGFCMAETEDAEKIYSFLSENFSKYTGCIPEYDDFSEDISNKRVIIHREDEISGVLHFSVRGNTSEIRHLAVLGKMRRQGIAGSLVNAFFNATDSKKYQVWLKKDNMAAFNLYSKYGFKADGFESLVYTKGI